MPTFENVQINHLSEDAPAWFAELLRVIETLDPAAVVEMMSDDITASQDSGVTFEHGRDQIRKTLEDGWAQTTSLFHDELNVYGTDSNFVHEARTTIGLADGQSIISPASYDPELVTVLDDIDLPDVVSLGMIDAVRAGMASPPVNDVLEGRQVDLELHTVPTPAGGITASVLRPRVHRDGRPGMFYLHAGGTSSASTRPPAGGGPVRRCGARRRAGVDDSRSPGSTAGCAATDQPNAR